VREIKPLVLAHLCFNSYAPELVPIFYSAIKPGYRCFIILCENQYISHWFQTKHWWL